MVPTKFLSTVLEVMAAAVPMLVVANQHGDPGHDGPGEYEEITNKNNIWW